MHLSDDKAQALHTLLDSLYCLNRRPISAEAKAQILDHLLNDEHLLHVRSELAHRFHCKSA